MNGSPLLVRHRRSLFHLAGTSLAELSVALLCLAIAGGVIVFLYSGIKGYEQGVQVSQDLRALMIAQKKAILNGLYSPPGLCNYRSGASWLSETTLKNQNLLAPFLEMDTLGGVVDSATIPPTYSWDGNNGWFRNIPKVPLRAGSGDGLSDVGPEY